MAISGDEIQRGSTMNRGIRACPECEAALWDSGFCPRCDRHTVPPQPLPQYRGHNQEASAWRRWVTGAIALTLGGLSIVGLWGVAEAASCDPATEWCIVSPRLVFVALVLPLWIMATPFFLATVSPFGRRRRLLVALGWALLAAAATYLAFALAGQVKPGQSIVLWAAAVLGNFCLTFYLAYRLAR